MRLTTELFVRWHRESVKYSNLPDRYIKRAMEQVYWKTPNKPNYLPRTVERKKFFFNTSRPWERKFYFHNAPGTMRQTIHVQPIKDWSFFRGDKVEILVGDDKGKQGKVTQIIAERNWVYVEGLHTRLHRMGKEENFPGIYIKQEMPLCVLNDIKLVDPSDSKATDVEWRYTIEGDRVRVSTRTGRIIPIPVSDNETIDYKLPHLYNDKPKDTLKADVEEITFEPVLKTFEMDIMDKMGIKEDRIPKKYYWY
ncbi:probable 39S ribosomal protein L24, mitochondrial [Venturia canescens]|uniref:probable 39S ribosomal protein L24, mitochondrial n=1 Tax=Venturia canescens TaxID=32260 RepID=UPI001C9D5A5B|nr:probable 39S ribosomal protein L24, mitochondrial [Venturia canescens]